MALAPSGPWAVRFDGGGNGPSLNGGVMMGCWVMITPLGAGAATVSQSHEACTRVRWGLCRWGKTSPRDRNLRKIPSNLPVNYLQSTSLTLACAQRLDKEPPNKSLL